MKRLLLLLYPMLLCAGDSTFHIIQRANRRVNARTTRATTANNRAVQPLAIQLTNGDQERYADKRGSYGKALEQLANGLIDPVAFNELVLATQRGTSDAYLDITMGTNPVQKRLADPQAALAFNLEGADGWINSMPPAPSLTSAQAAGEMVENYWQALMRDVFYNDYDTDTIAAAAIADLNSLSDFRGPKSGGLVTPQTLFRGVFTGDLVGPYISQFLYKAVPYGPPANTDSGVSGTPGIDFQAQKVPNSGTSNDFMIDVNVWKAIQTGANPTATTTYTADRLFIRNGRDLAEYVHFDYPDQPFTNAALILLSFGSAALDKNNPYVGNPTQAGFVTYGIVDVLNLVSIAADYALRAAWYQKWCVHLRLRPEFYGYLVQQQKTGAANYGLSDEIINSPALNQVFTTFGTYLLPQAYPEGCPAHPSYPAGHAAISGACATILKAFFNEDFVIPSPIEPDAANTALTDYIGTPLTVGGELNKLASNISLGRDTAGVHYRSDGQEGMLLGEKIALAILEDEAYTRNINFKGYTLTKFDGTRITIGAKRTVPTLN